MFALILRSNFFQCLIPLGLRRSKRKHSGGDPTGDFSGISPSRNPMRAVEPLRNCSPSLVPELTPSELQGASEGRKTARVQEDSTFTSSFLASASGPGKQT